MRKLKSISWSGSSFLGQFTQKPRQYTVPKAHLATAMATATKTQYTLAEKISENPAQRAEIYLTRSRRANRREGRVKKSARAQIPGARTFRFSSDPRL